MTASEKKDDGPRDGCNTLQVRGDLHWSSAIKGQPFDWVAKDPIAIKYFRLRDDERFVLQQLNGVKSIPRIRDEYNIRYTPRRVTNAQVQQLVMHFFREGLVTSLALNQDRTLLQYRRRQTLQRWPAWMTSWLFLRFPGVYADPIVQRIERWLRPVLSAGYLWLAVIFILGSSAWLLLNAAEFIAEVQRFQHWANLQGALLLGLTIGIAKTLHELGHGVLAKRLGAECHEIGIMLMFGVPCLYCDTSDLWTLPHRGGRMLVAAGGMLTELLIASAAVWLWTASHAGILHWLSFNLILVCMLTTVLINANPLLRYDGYYLLADAVSIDNLSHEASQRTWRCGGWLFTGRWPAIWPERSLGGQIALVAYTLAAWFYRALIFLAIGWLVLTLSRQWGIQRHGWQFIALGAATLLAAGVLPAIIKLGTRLRQPGGWARSGVRTPRLIVVLSILAATGYWALLVPRQRSLVLVGEFHPAHRQAVVGQTPAKLQQFSEYAGSVVPGQTLVQLGSLETRLERLEAERKLREQQILVSGLQQAAVAVPELAEQIPTAQAVLTTLREQLDLAQTQLDALRLKANREGRWLSPLERALPRDPSERLPSWSRQPLAIENQSTMIKPGEVLGWLADNDLWQVTLFADQNVIEWLRPGQSAVVCLASQPQTRLSATVTDVGVQPVAELSARQAKLPGMASRPTDRSTFQPLSPSYSVTLQVNCPEPLTIPPPLLGIDGLEAKARILLGTENDAQRLWRWLAGQLRF